MQKKFGAVAVDNPSSRIVPNIECIRFDGGTMQTPMEVHVPADEVERLFQLLAIVFEQGKLERSLEIQKALNGGESIVRNHTIKLNNG
jgi:hypothetical protein